MRRQNELPISSLFLVECHPAPGSVTRCVQEHDLSVGSLGIAKDDLGSPITVQVRGRHRARGAKDRQGGMIGGRPWRTLSKMPTGSAN